MSTYAIKLNCCISRIMNLLKDILNTLFARTSELFRNSKKDNKSIETLCYELLSSKGQLSAMTLSQNILSRYNSLSDIEKKSFFLSDTLKQSCF